MKLAKLDCKYGAPMGRTGKDLTGNLGAIKLHLQHVPLDSGGYDEGGAYWGLRPMGAYIRPDGLKVQARVRIYRYWWNGNKPSASKPILIEGFIDAFSREHAKEQIREKYKEATFYR